MKPTGHVNSEITSEDYKITTNVDIKKFAKDFKQINACR